MKRKITTILILISMSLLQIQSCVTYEVKRLGGMKENEKKLEKMIDKQIKENYELHSETYKKEEKK